MILRDFGRRKPCPSKYVTAGKVEPEFDLATHGPSRVARQQVDLAGLEGIEAVGRGERHEIHLARIAQDSSSDGATEIGVEAGSPALAVRGGKPEHALADPTIKHSAFLHSLQRLRRSR